jgi:DNA topoisomerase VI subunit A
MPKEIPEITDEQFERIVQRLVNEERWDEIKILVACGEGSAVRNSVK